MASRSGLAAGLAAFALALGLLPGTARAALTTYIDPVLWDDAVSNYTIGTTNPINLSGTTFTSAAGNIFYIGNSKNGTLTNPGGLLTMTATSSDPYVDLSIFGTDKAMKNDYGLGLFITGAFGDTFLIAIGSAGGTSCDLLGTPGSCTTVSTFTITIGDSDSFFFGYTYDASPPSHVQDIIIADISAQPHAFSINTVVEAVPEPASITLLGAGLIALGALRRKR